MNRDFDFYMQKFKELEPNWDGYGARTIDQNAMNVASYFVGELSEDHQPEYVFPTPDGGIQIEWGYGAIPPYLEIEFYPDKDSHHTVIGFLAEFEDLELGDEGISLYQAKLLVDRFYENKGV